MLVIALGHAVVLALLNYSFVNTSGGHFSRLVTWATVTTGQTRLVRGVLYYIAQVVGAILAASFMKHEYGGTNEKQYDGSGLVFGGVRLSLFTLGPALT